MDSQERVPAARVFGDYKLLVKVLSGISWIPGFPRFLEGPMVRFLVQLGGTCRGFRRAASKLVDQRAVERIVSRMPTRQWVDLASATWTDEPTITSRVRAVVHTQALVWWTACPFRLHDLGGIARTSALSSRANKARSLLSLLSESRPEYRSLVERLLDKNKPSVNAIESVEKLRELLLAPDNPANVEKYGTPEAYDIRDLKSLEGLKFFRDTDVRFWDTSHVTNMSYMVDDLLVRLNGIEHWNTVRVTSMRGAFAHSASFNQDIGKWDVGRVTNMGGMFTYSGFNQDIGKRDTSSVKDMNGMFKGASAFNQDIGKWDTSSANHMSNMFQGASAFNQDIGKWDVGQVLTMNQMFEGAAAFDRDLSDWAVGSVVFAILMLISCPIREAHMPPTGLAVRGPRATELRPELTRIIGELGLTHMRIVCVDTTTGLIRVSLNRSMIGVASSSKSASEMRAQAQNSILRCVCRFYTTGGSKGPEGPKGSNGKGRLPVTVQFNWTAPLDRPRPWTWTCGSTEQPEPLEPKGNRAHGCSVS